MRPSILTAALLMGLSAASLPAQPTRLPADACATLAACEQRLREMAPLDPSQEGIANAQAAVAARLGAFPDATPRLMSMLDDPDHHLARLAAYALRFNTPIDIRWMPQIRARIDRGNEQLAPALANVPGEEAANAVVAYFLDSGTADHYQAIAVVALGPRAIAPIVAAARCPDACRDRAHDLLGEVLQQLGEDGVAAAPSLRALAADPATPDAVAAGMVRMIGAIGPPAAAQAPPLLALRDARPALRADIDETLTRLEVADAAAVFAARLREKPDLRQLEALAALGIRGRTAGPAVLSLLTLADPGPAVPLLEDDAADMRVAAARTLGAIGHVEAIPALRAALRDPRDVRLVWAAATALGQLQATAAASDLDELARHHWYPPVREAATQAIAALRPEPAAAAPPAPAAAATPVPDEDEATTLTFDAFTDIPGSVDACRQLEVAAVADGADEVDASSPEAVAALRELAFDSVVLSYGENGEHRRPIRAVPNAALRVAGGWLVGTNRGEWGGELVFLPTDGAPVKVYDGNVEDIYPLGDRVVATVGVTHMFFDLGRVIELTRDEAGWRADSWRTLPSAPARSWHVESGELLIQTYNGGTLLLAKDGGMRMAPCADPIGDQRPATSD